MRNYKFTPLGQTFQEGHVTLKVELCRKPNKCVGCWYNAKNYKTGKKNGVRYFTGSCYIHGNACTPGTRKDGLQVIFVEQKV